jgi:flagellar protein FliO/FliZ
VLELTVRIIFSLLIVVGLMWGLARLARRPLGGRRGGLIEVLDRRQLSRGASLVVVRVAETAMVLGVTDGRVALLAEVDPTALEEHQRIEPVHRQAIALDRLGEDGTPLAPGLFPNRPLNGSILSPRTFTQTWKALRERMVRKP